MSLTEKPARQKLVPGKPRVVVLREFGLVMALALVVIAGILLWQGRTSALYLLLAAAGFIIAGLYFPLLLNRPERLWMIFAEKLGVLMTYILVTLVFFLAVTPTALLLRLLGKDLLGLKLDSAAGSYWVRTESDGPGSRPFLPY